MVDCLYNRRVTRPTWSLLATVLVLSSCVNLDPPWKHVDAASPQGDAPAIDPGGTGGTGGTGGSPGAAGTLAGSPGNPDGSLEAAIDDTGSATPGAGGTGGMVGALDDAGGTGGMAGALDDAGGTGAMADALDDAGGIGAMAGALDDAGRDLASHLDARCCDQDAEDAPTVEQADAVAGDRGVPDADGEESDLGMDGIDLDGTSLGPNLALDATWWGDGVSLNKTGNYPRIFVSSVQSTSANTAAGLSDGSTSTFWVSAGDAATPTTFPQWVGVEFGAPVTITAIVLDGRMNDDRAYDPSNYTIQTSNDGTTWTDQVTVAPPTSYPLTQNPATSPITTWLPTPTSATWVRLYITAAFYVIAGQAQTTVPNVQISELEIH